MAKKSQSHGTSDAIQEFESLAERGAHWIRDHLALAIAALVAVVGGAAGIGVYDSYQTGQAEAASDALDQATTGYLKAMGARPGDIAVPELANPAAAEAIRAEFASKFTEIAEAHRGTVAGALAQLEAGNLTQADGDLEASVEIWRQTVAGLPGDSVMRAFLHQRIGQAYESADRWTEAGEAHAAAAEFEAFPLRYWALAAAARCFVEAGDAQRARQLALRLQAEAPELNLPEHLRAQLREARAAPSP